MLAIQWIFNSVISLYVFVILIMVVMSWLFMFNVINRGNPFVDSIWTTVIALTEPALRPIRNMLPNTGGLDLSPIILFIGLQALQIFANNYVFAPLIRQGL
ncbi:MAG: YggT family protein [Pseudomonadota bacterium]